MTNEGNKLSKEYLISRGFEKEVIEAEFPLADEEIMYIKDGITIYWDQWGSENPFAFATYVRGDGRYKGGFTIFTDTQLENLYFSLANKTLNEVGSQEDIKDQINMKEREIQSLKDRVIRYPNDENVKDHLDRMLPVFQKELDELYLLLK